MTEIVILPSDPSAPSSTPPDASAREIVTVPLMMSMRSHTSAAIVATLPWSTAANLAPSRAPWCTSFATANAQLGSTVPNNSITTSGRTMASSTVAAPLSSREWLNDRDLG